VDLLRQIRRAQEDVNRLFGGLQFLHRGAFPAVNVWAGPEGVVVLAKLPGVNPDRLEASVHQDTLTLRGSRELEPVAGDGVAHRRELAREPFTRTIVLPFRVDADRVSARSERGLLTLEMPRRPEDKPRRIAIAHA
jgi:HSP20 family protein